MRLFCPRGSTGKDMLPPKLSPVHRLKADMVWWYVFFRIIFCVIFTQVLPRHEQRRMIITCNLFYTWIYEAHILGYLDIFVYAWKKNWYRFQCINTYSILWLKQSKLLWTKINVVIHMHTYFQTHMVLWISQFAIMLWHENAFRITGLFVKETTSNTELLCFLVVSLNKQWSCRWFRRDDAHLTTQLYGKIWWWAPLCLLFLHNYTGTIGPIW